eukprot:3598726-Lingulodinium_polyedra.AAC.1
MRRRQRSAQTTLQDVYNRRAEEPLHACAELFPGICRTADAMHLKHVKELHLSLWRWVTSRWTSMTLEGEMLVCIYIRAGAAEDAVQKHYFLGRRLGNPCKLVFVETVADDSCVKLRIENGMLKHIGGHALCWLP